MGRKKRIPKQDKEKGKITFSLYPISRQKKIKGEKAKMEEINQEDLDLEKEFQTEKKEVAEIDWEKEEEIESVFTFMDKKEFVGKVTKVTLVSLSPNTNRKGLLVGLSVNGKEYRVDLNKENKNFLVKTFGGNKREWIGKQFYFTASEVPYKSEGVEKIGYGITFSS